MNDEIVRWVSAGEAAVVMGVSKRSVERFAAAGRVEARRTPGGWEWRIAVDADGWAVEPLHATE